MTNIRIVTDSCASIPEDLLRELNIQTVAYYIHRGKEVLRDLVTIQRDDFLRWLPTAKILPTTASPGPGDYFQTYRHMAEEGVQAVISIHMTSKGSGAYQAAVVAQEMAKEQLPGLRVEVIDTLNVSLCQGWMAIESARSAISGLSVDAILGQIRSLIPITSMIQTADTLKYLYMGGRIGGAQRLVGELLSIKPLIGMKDGVIVALGQARSRMGAYREMIDLMKESIGNGKAKVAYVHAGAYGEVEKIKHLVEENVDVVESLIAELSPALAVHTGPGTAGLCFYPIQP